MYARTGTFALVTIAVWTAGISAPARAQSGPAQAGPLAPTARRFSVGKLDRVDRILVPSIDYQAVTAEDDLRSAQGLPPRFALAHPVSVTPATNGTWEDVAGNQRLWRLRVASPGARSINLGFTRYRMPAGGRLYIYPAGGQPTIRPFTSQDNKPHGQLWTPPVPADEVVIEVTLPATETENLDLELGSINVGYRAFGVDVSQAGGGLRSGSCNVDVVCPEGAGWEGEIQSVAVYSTGGSTFCTGFLVNDTANDLTPYFMTADHCGLSAANAASLVVFWNFQNSTCRPPGSAASGQPGDGSLSDFQTGATFRAGYAPSDFTLLELDSMPIPAWNIYYAGWDRTGVDEPGAIAIHHPNTDEKRISFENDPTSTATYLQTAVPGDGTHIRITDWDLGTTEPGSSGSPLFNPAHRIIGQLHGGFAACGNNDSDWYGKFAVSWNGGGTVSSRLSDWLDPLGSGAMTVDTIFGGGMSVSPSGTVIHEGLSGGPFTNPSIVYTLSNPSPSPINYQVALTSSFGILLDGGTAPVAGVLAASGGSTTVTVSLGPAIDLLTAGVYTEDITFDDLTNGLTLTRTHVVEVDQNGIDVTPTTDLVSGGPVGGPFSASQVYTVTSTKPAPVSVEVSAGAPWVSLDGGPGPVMLNLAGSGDFATVTVGYDASANSLAAGLYVSTVSFANLSGGAGSTVRNVTLDVGRFLFTATDVPQAINDNSSLTSVITVPDDFCIGDLDVDVNITHTFIGDLTVTLTSPSGTSVTLHNQSGGSADNIIKTYDDDTEPVDGPGLLADFNDETIQGNWTLQVSDSATGDTGTLNSWSLKPAASAGGCPPPPQVIISYNLDTPPGWSTTGLWAFGQPQGVGGDPASGFTGLNVYGYNLSGDYTNNMSEQYLTTKSMDLTGVTGTKVRFRRWLGVESASFDHAGVEVSNNGTTWTRVWDHTGGTLDEQSWSLVTYDISAVADNQPNVFIRWVMGTTDGSVTFHGWNIDDIEILGVAPPACTTPADMDGDGDVDLIDLSQFALCFGPGGGLIAGCECADLDTTTNDIDLADWALMEPLITGP